MTAIATAERALYEAMWQHPEYAQWSPGVAAIPRFLRLVDPAPGARIVDWGCGTGKAGAELARRGYAVLLVDQTPAGLTSETRDLPFVPSTLWAFTTSAAFEVGFCVDVLEHVPTELTGLTIFRLLDVTPTLYLEVSTEPDAMGSFVGQTLHKTVKPFAWWRDLVAEIGRVRVGIDLLDRAAFVVEAE